MKFVLVNGRTPYLASTCAWCCEPIGEAYLRELPARLPFCDHRCYFAHLQCLEDFRAAKADEAIIPADQAAAVARMVKANRDEKRRNLDSPFNKRNR
jgi:hypothetical protein